MHAFRNRQFRQNLAILCGDRVKQREDIVVSRHSPGIEHDWVEPKGLLHTKYELRSGRKELANLSTLR